MPQGSRGRKGGSGLDEADPKGSRAVRPGRQAALEAAGDGVDSGSALRQQPADVAVLDCILTNTREMKKLALRAGFSRVALILEMAELEAADQMPKVRGTQR